LLRTVGEILGSAIERTRVEEQIRELQKLESIGLLAAGVAHDLNNMLTPIIGYAELLERGLSSAPDLEGHAREITRAGKRSRDLVQQLLAFSRRQTLSMQTVDLRQIVTGVEKLLRRTLRENIEIEVVLPGDPCPVRADVGQIEQIVMNLAVNAQDAMPQGGHLSIEAEVVDGDDAYAASHAHHLVGPHVLLSVSDTGVGMDEDTKSHAFEPFFTTKERGHGTGLGLATVYGIVKQHGGSIWLYSEPNRGTVCKVYLPAADAAAIEPTTKPVVELSAARRKETVMVVEDNDMVRDLVARILVHVGCTVLVAGSGRECLETLARHEGPLHLLLTDVVMPDLDGWELFTRVAQQYPDAKAVFMSGYTHNVIAHHGVLEEGIHFIQKPFSVTTLLDKLSEVLDQR
jgi:nitrogen-specific signal transduction histidine kinase/CheY-like chemotaxis protein